MRHIVIGLILVLALMMSVNAETLKVTVYNPNDYDLMDYQVRIDLSGYLDSVSYLKIIDESGNDLKFCYEQPNGECEVNPTTIVWVKVPEIPAKSDAHIYIESSSTNYAVNGDLVFDFYDDFTRNTIGLKWEKLKDETGNEIMIVNGRLYLHENSGDNDGVALVSKNIMDFNGLQIEMIGEVISISGDLDFGFGWNKDKKELPQAYGYLLGMGIGDYPSDPYQYWGLRTDYDCLSSNPAKLNLLAGGKIGAGKAGTIFYGMLGYISGSIQGKLKIISSGYSETLKAFKNIPTNGYLALDINDGIPSKIAVDWIRVRKYTDIEPTITIEKAKPPTPKPKLTLTIQTDTELKEGETRYSKLIIKNEGTAPAQNVVVMIFSQGLNIQITENLGTLQPQESREIPFYVEAKYSGQYKVSAKAEYTDGLNKYIEETQKIITVRASEIPSISSQQGGKKGKLSISLTTDVIKAKVGQEFAVTLSVVNYITNPDATLQIILKPPSGMSVTSAEFVQAGMGQYTATYHVKSGEAKAIQILLKPNNAGEFVINGEVIYYFGNDKQNCQSIPISQRVIVEDVSSSTIITTLSKQEQTTIQTINKTPGFEAVLFVIAVVLTVRRCKR